MFNLDKLVGSLTKLFKGDKEMIYKVTSLLKEHKAIVDAGDHKGAAKNMLNIATLSPGAGKTLAQDAKAISSVMLTNPDLKIGGITSTGKPCIIKRHKHKFGVFVAIYIDGESLNYEETSDDNVMLAVMSGLIGIFGNELQQLLITALKMAKATSADKVDDFVTAIEQLTSLPTGGLN